jgi:hypothetical protein
MRFKLKHLISVRVTTIILIGLFSVLTVLLFFLKDNILSAHVNGQIYIVSSDAPVYLQAYENIYSDRPLLDITSLYFLNSSPVFLLKIFNGNLLIILTANLLLMFASLKVALNCFKDRNSRILFIIGALLFPSFLVGFLSLNKEIYAMSSAIFFASYYLRGKIFHLIIALILAFLARYYMFMALIFTMMVFPRKMKPRYRVALITLLVISLSVPFLKSFIPGYSNENLLEDAGVTSRFYSYVIDSFGYILIYPIKYLGLVPMRLWSVAIGSERMQDSMEAIVSLLSILLIVAALYIIVMKKRLSSQFNSLIMMAFIAPIPIMWTEITHWRYFSFVYFFLLFAVVEYIANRRRMHTESLSISHGLCGNKNK